MIRAILFDLDGTLRFNHPSGLEAFIQFSAELGLTFHAEAQRNVERWTHAYWSGKHNGVAFESQDPGAFWLSYTANMLEAAGVEDNALTLARALCQAFGERYRPRPFVHPQAHQVLRELHEGGFTLGLVSNRVDDLTPVVADLGLGDCFHFTLSGGQVGAWKPDARIFVRACEMAQAAPGECLYVGDNYYADAQGAQSAGLVPVLLDPRNVFSDVHCIRIADLDDLLPVVGSITEPPRLA
jgi:putative hydrolase of the HAD superfamily